MLLFQILYMFIVVLFIIANELKSNWRQEMNKNSGEKKRKIRRYSIWTYMSPFILNQASAHCLWAAAKSSLQEQPNSMGIPDSWLEASKLRWQIRQSLSIFAKCTLISANPHSRSISTEQSETEDLLLFSATASSRMSALDWAEHRRTSSEAGEESVGAAESGQGRSCSCCRSTSIATTWEFWIVVMAKTQKENPHVMALWGQNHEWAERERSPMKGKKRKERRVW